MDKTSFGNGLLSMVAIHLSTNGPLDELLVLLNGVRTDLQKQQELADEENKTRQAECDGEIQNFQQQIAAFTAQRNENIKIRDLNLAALAIAEKDLRETMSSLAVNQKRLTEGQAERDTQHEEYASRLADREQGIHALDAAISLLQHLQSGSSFIQLRKRFEKVTTELLEVSKKSKTGHLYTPLITALTELAAKASPETITKILGLFNELRQKFVADQQTETNVENNQMKSWISLKTDLETEREQLNDRRIELEGQIEGYHRIIDAAKKNIASLTEQLNLANENLQRTVDTCTEAGLRYESTSRER